MKKIFLLLFCLIILTSCFSKDNTISEVSEEKVEIEETEERFWVLTKYIKADIVDSESTQLQKILDDRKEKLVEIKIMLETATKDDKDEIYEKIINTRKALFDEISIYVPEEKMQSFTRYNDKLNLMIKNKLDNK